MPAKAGIHDFLCCDEGKSWIPGLRRHDGVARWVNRFATWYYCPALLMIGIRSLA